ncbi:MAG: helix-turn-helix domain-containing protein [Pseudomonadota bacterium]
MSNLEKTIGQTLKQTREDLKITLDEVSRTLKVKLNDIIALEEDSLHLITKHLYLIGFIKSYCHFLKMKNEVIEEYLKNITSSCNTKNKKHQLINLEADTDRNPSKDHLVNALIIFAMIYLLLISFSQFKSQNLAITDLIINHLDKIE